MRNRSQYYKLIGRLPVLSRLAIASIIIRIAFIYGKVY